MRILAYQYRQWCLFIAAIAGKSNLNKYILEKEMKIPGLRIDWFHTSRTRRRKVPDALERIINVALLDAAVKNTEVLAKVIDKYGAIQLHHHDMIATEAENIRDRVNGEVVQTILNSRRQELISHVNGIIDRVMGLNSVPDVRRHEERTLEGVTSNGRSSTTNIVHQRRAIRRSAKHGLNPSVIFSGTDVTIKTPYKRDK